MEFAIWAPWYRDICDDFGFDSHEDSKAANLLNSLIGTQASTPHILKECINHRQVTICGAGPSLEKNIDRIDGTIITADEATSIVMDYQLPDIIVTDLDGNVEDQITANQEGCIVVIHAHGDNMNALRRYAPCFPGPFVLTTQAKPLDRVFNFGGFTDGDRAYLMAKQFGADTIQLLGFDFDTPRPKKGKNQDTKRRKLRWAHRLIECY